MEKLQFNRPGELSVELVQMTPMIHFQATEKGATLRATEVKPKLDRYLLHAAFHDNKAEYGKYLVGRDPKNDEDSAALDYRLVVVADPGDFESPIDLVIKSQRTDRNGRTKTITTFTGALWDSEKIVQSSMLKRGKTIRLIFRSKHTDLIKIIGEWIDAFFAGENFGQRQSKGFGSFLTWDSSQSLSACLDAFEKHIRQSLWKIPESGLKIYHFSNKQAVRFDQWKLILDDIRDMHRVLKSGENLYNEIPEKRKYTPSFLMKTFAKNDERLSGFENEKKLMKTELLQNKHIPGLLLPSYDKKPNAAAYIYDNENIRPQQIEVSKGRFLRALLGLAPFYEFRPLTLKNTYGTYMARIAISDPDTEKPVARFRSPITYKPIFIEGKWRCYLIPTYIPEEMFGKTFSLSIVPLEKRKNQDLLSQLDEYNRKLVLKKTLEIQTPSREEFDLLRLLDKFCATNVRIRWRTENNDSGIRSFEPAIVKKEEGRHE